MVAGHADEHHKDVTLRFGLFYMTLYNLQNSLKSSLKMQEFDAFDARMFSHKFNIQHAVAILYIGHYSHIYTILYPV